MIPTVAELRAGLLKAGRGLGVPLGVAEDVAEAAPFILADPQPDAMLAAILRGLESGDITDTVATIDTALATGAANLDDTLTARALVGLAAYRAQRVLRLEDGKVTARESADISLPRPMRPTINDVIWTLLQGYAARTYVPATDESRLKGAGAGLSDND